MNRDEPASQPAYNRKRSATPESIAFGERLRTLVARSGLNAAEVAAKISKSRPHLSRMMAGDYMPRAREMDALAEVFGVPVGVLYGQEPVPPTAEERAMDLMRHAVEAARGVPIPVLGAVPGPAVDLELERQKALDVVYVAQGQVASAFEPIALNVTDNAWKSIGIWRGDTLIIEIDHERRPRDGELVLIEAGRDFRLARTYRTGGEMLLVDADGQTIGRADHDPIVGYYQTFVPHAPR